jgi:mono/diheme cytochrome c family protein
VKALLAATAAVVVAFAGCARERPGAAASARAAAARRNVASIDDGARVYIANCSGCHQLDGRGVPGAFPPLAGNPVVTGNPARVVAIVRRGSRGRERVLGAWYGGEMPGWEGLLSNDEIAQVVSYIRAAWNNDAPPIPLAESR